MAIYLSSFAVSCILIRCVENKKKNNLIFIGGSFLALLIPCLLAGLRAETIGTDVRVYVKQLYEAAKYTDGFKEYFGASWFDSWRDVYVKDFEYGFSIMVYIITKIFGNLSAVLFFIHALIVIPIYKGLLYYKGKQPVWLGMLVFYLLDFNVSLNMMRQWIAMAFLLCGFKYLVNNERRKYFLITFIAVLFHTSGVLGILIYFVYTYIYSNKISKRKFVFSRVARDISTYKVIILALAGVAVLVGLKMVIQLMNVIGLSRYINYFAGDVKILPKQIIVRLPIIILFIFNWTRLKKYTVLAPFYMSMLVFDLLMSQLTSVNVYSGRIAVFFSEYNILSYPALYASFTRKSNRIFLLLGILVYLLVYWWYYFVYIGANATVPYVSIFQ